MEYILFGIGVVLVIASLYLTYRVEQDQDSYYLESELISEIREVKQDMEASFNSQQFNQLLEAERDNKKITKEVQALQDTMGQLEGKLDNISKKISKIEGRINNLQLTNKQQSTETAASDQSKEFKPEKYEEIKELADAGLSMAEIARELDMGNREVDLIWKLNTRGEE